MNDRAGLIMEDRRAQDSFALFFWQLFNALEVIGEISVLNRLNDVWLVGLVDHDGILAQCPVDLTNGK